MNHFSTNDYSGYTEADFIADPFFQDWVVHPSREKESFWKEFLALYPEKRETLHNARFFLKRLRFREEYPEEPVVSQRFQQHLARVNSSPEARVVPVRRSFTRYLRVAAVLGGVILLGAALLLWKGQFRPEQVVIGTQYGEIKHIVLPDSSRIVLNAHSRITYGQSWNSQEPREVWLEGEAFFDVKHLNHHKKNILPHERFRVHTSDLLVEVLGTEFNIRQRRGKTEVVLREGQVRVFFKDSSSAPMILKPGDLITYHPDEKKKVVAETNAGDYTAWTEQKLVLQDPTLSKIVQYLEDTYGKKIVLKDPQLGKRKIEGPILLNDLDDALFIISTVLSTEVEQRDSIILIRPR